MYAITLQRLGDGTFVTPSAKQPSADCDPVSATPLCPPGTGKSFSFDGNQSVLSSVITLLPSRRPTDIAGFVVTAVVNALHRMLSGRSQSHFGNEMLKGSEPKLNTTPAVFEKSFVVRVITSILSRCVNAIFLRARQAVRGELLTSPLRLIAPARNGDAINKSDSSDRLNRSALTLTEPLSDAINRSGIAENCKATEGSSVKVLKGLIVRDWVKGNGRIVVRRIVLLNRMICLDLRSCFNTFVGRSHYNTRRYALSAFVFLALAIGVTSSQAQTDKLAISEQRLNKVLDALDKAEALSVAKDETILAKDDVIKAKDESIIAKDALIKAQDEQIQRLIKIKCSTSSFLIFIYRSKKCY
jgi:hypothetical protein